MSAGSTSTSAGARAGAATKSRVGLLVNRFRRARTMIVVDRSLPDKLPSQPKEGLFEVVVRFGGDFEVLDALLSVESDLSSLHFSLLQIAGQDPGCVVSDVWITALQ